MELVWILSIAIKKKHKNNYLKCVRLRAERFVITTPEAVMVTVLIHQRWKIMRQNVLREPWAGSCCQVGKQGHPLLGTPGLHLCWEGTAGAFLWDSDISTWHQSSESRIIHSAAVGISGSGAPALSPCQRCPLFSPGNSTFPLLLPTKVVFQQCSLHSQAWPWQCL